MISSTKTLSSHIASTKAAVEGDTAKAANPSAVRERRSFGMLEVVKSDFSKNMAELFPLQRVEVAVMCQKLTQEGEVSTERDVMYKWPKKAGLEESAGEAASDGFREDAGGMGHGVHPDESKFFGIEEYDADWDPKLNDTCVAKAITHEKYPEPPTSWCQAKPSESEARQKPHDYELENLADTQSRG